MWEEEAVFGFAMTMGRARYIFEERVIIKIFEDVILTYSEPKKKYFAEIIHPEANKFNRVKIFCSDYNSIKFKSLIKAKELGWNITDLKI